VSAPGRQRIPVTIVVNGERREAEVEPRRLLSDVLRSDFGLTGTHVGCEHGVCGCCTVLVDDEPVRACLMLGVQADGAAVTTVEGLAGPDGRLHPLQEAFRRHHALQCGFCTPGFLMALLPAVRSGVPLTDDEITELAAGQLCRCTGYAGIVAALREATAGPHGR
jgi:aerobic-type carbon monoxide dehydrogenase small subunit (CoxS/CutS family)